MSSVNDSGAESVFEDRDPELTAIDQDSRRQRTLVIVGAQLVVLAVIAVVWYAIRSRCCADGEVAGP